jgi:hypothetical protein
MLGFMPGIHVFGFVQVKTTGQDDIETRHV